jgi:paraquat-inducible protein A
VSPPPPVATANRAGLIGCEHCGALSPLHPDPIVCPRCGATLHRRKPDSLNRTFALLVAAMILYLPANLLPVMVTTSLFRKTHDTIISGVVYFWNTGSMGLAVLIFSFSILIPMLKMGALGFLVISVRHSSARTRRQRMVLFRIVEFVGRWSMLDVFVVALMAGLVRFHSLAMVEAGPGAAAFGAVVVLTMLASFSFDSRLIWDNDEKCDER